MWIIPRTSRFSHFVQGTESCVLILPAWVFRGVFTFSDEFKIGENVVACIEILMVNIKALWYGAVCRFPHIPVQIGSRSASRCVIPIFAAGVFFARKHDERQGLDPFSHLQSATKESYVNSLPRDLKCLSYLGQAKALLIKLVHCVGYLNVWFTTHTLNITERLTSVN